MESIIQKFEKHFYIDYVSDEEIVASQAKEASAKGFCPITGMPKRFSSDVSVEDAINSFVNSLTDEEKSKIRITGDSGEYVDAEEHDAVKKWTEITVQFFKSTKQKF